MARELGVTEGELKEGMALSMTVGATKIQILHQKAFAVIHGGQEKEGQLQGGEGTPASGEACST